MTKLCVDCKHFKSHWGMTSFGDCKKYVMIPEEINLVTGETIKPTYGMATFYRIHNRCGPEGKLWEPKPPNKYLAKILKLFA